jgi:hypothetical protein
LPGRFIGKIGQLPAESGRFGPPPDPPLRRPIYQQKRPITGGLQLISSPSQPIQSAAHPIFAPADLSAKSADYRPKPADFHPVTAESPSPGPPLAPLSTGPNGE